MYLFQRKHHPCQRGMKSCRQSGACPAGKEIFFLCLSTVQDLRYRLPCHGSDLYGRAFSSKRQSRQKRKEASQEFSGKHPPPGLFQFSCHLPFYLGNTAAGYHRLPLYQFSHNTGHENQQDKPSPCCCRISSGIAQDHIHSPACILQKNSVQQHHHTGDQTYQKALSCQYGLKMFCSADHMGGVLLHLPGPPYQESIPPVRAESLPIGYMTIFIIRVPI